MSKLPMAARTCGACSMCCVVPKIDELGKPENTPCEHLTPHGCGCYENRPSPICGDFECGWLQGIGDASQRPDRVGYYLTQGTPLPGVGPTVVVHAPAGRPPRFGAAARRWIRRVVAADGAVFVICGRKRSVMTNNHRVRDTVAGVVNDDATWEPA